MLKITFIILSVLCGLSTIAQNGFLIVKKHKKAERIYGKDDHLTFQQRNGDWITGIVTRIDKDSISFTREIIHYYSIGVDTLHISGYRFAPEDIRAIPSKKQLFVYSNDQVRLTLGHERFVWLRNGFMLQVAGAGYIGLNVINDLTSKQPPFARNHLDGLGIAALAFLTGTILHWTFDPTIRIGKKYKLEFVSY